MPGLLFVLTHSTAEPDRAVTGLHAALAAQREGGDVALWLTGDGVRLGVEGVAETLHEDVPESAAAMLAALLEGGAAVYLDRYAFARRLFEPDAVRAGATLADSARLGALLAEGRSSVTL